MSAAAREGRLVVGDDGLAFPYDLVTDVTGVVARRGGGKSFFVHRLIEAVVAALIAQVIVIDPKGDYWGLRSSADGKGDGLPFTILGGQRGDVPLAHEAGGLIADLAVESGSHLLLDLSDFPSDAAECRFFAEFMQALYRLKARDHRIVLVVVEEAAQLLPQTQQGGGAQKGEGGWQSKSLSAGHKVAKMGRGRGIGMVIVDQRIADVSKKSLAQAGRLLFGGMTSPLDQAAVDAYAKNAVNAEDRAALMSAITSVPPGTLMAWAPDDGYRGVPLRAGALLTFDSHRTPKPGEHLAEPARRLTIDLGALGAKMSALVEEKQASDPAVLRSRLAALEAELARERAAKPAPPEPTVVEVKVPDAEAVAALRAASESVKTSTLALLDATRHVEGALAAVGEPVPERPTPAPPIPAPPAASPAAAAPLPPRRPAPAPPAPDGDLTSYQEELLRGFLVRSPATAAQLALVTGKSRKSSTFELALKAFRDLGYIEQGSPYRITERGRARCGDTEPVPTGPALVAYWRARLTKPAAKVFLDHIAAAGPDGIDRDALLAATGYSSTSSSTDDALKYLRDLELIVGGRGAPYRLVPELAGAR